MIINFFHFFLYDKYILKFNLDEYNEVFDYSLRF